MATVMAVYIGRAGGSPLAVGLVITVFFFGWTVCVPVWGALADITGRRHGVLLAAAGLATLPFLVVRGVVGPLAVRTVYALFAAAYLPILLTIVNTCGGDDERGRSGCSAARRASASPPASCRRDFSSASWCPGASTSS